MTKRNQAEPQVPVIFRVWKDTKDCVAFFPAMASDTNGYYCNAFEHVGQHGGADYAGCLKQTRPALPAEYKGLKRELESAPYHYQLKVVKRETPQMRKARRGQGR